MGKILEWIEKSKKYFVLPVSLVISLILIFIIDNYNHLNTIVLIILFIFIWGIVYVITNHIFSENKDKYIIILTALIILVSVLQLIVMRNQARIDGIQVGISENQAEISKIQTEILDKQSKIMDKSSQSIKPDLIAFSTRGYRKFPLDSINNEEDQTISLTVMNMGKSTATYAKIPIAPYTLFIGQYKEGEDVGENFIFYINQLKSLDSKAQTLDFRLNPSKEEILTPGVKNLTMRIYCDSCNEQRKDQIIPICIYSNDSAIIDECGHEWI